MVSELHAGCGTITIVADHEFSVRPQSKPLCACRGGFFVQYSKMEALGAGAFGTAYKARRRKVGLAARTAAKVAYMGTLSASL